MTVTKHIETTGKTEELAIAAALKQLGLDRDDVSVEVITRAKTGFLGIGSCPAKVRVSYEVEEQEPAPAPKAQEPAVPAAASVKAAPVSAPVKEPVKEAAAQEPARAKAPEQPRERRQSRPKAQKAPRPEQPKPQRQPKPAAPKAAAGEQEAAPDRSEAIVDFLTGLLAHLEVESTPVITGVEDGTYQVQLTGESLGALIGRRGETLDAIQQLTNYAVNHGQSRRVRVHVDCENYRAKREESLQRLARKTAGKAVKYRKNMMLEPMNAYERHVIHAELQDYHPNISTYSTGSEPNRRIVVAYNK